MELITYYPTIVLSDIHIGSKHSKTEKISIFLKYVNCDLLILNSDIIDGWQLQKQGTEIVYVRRNHYDFLGHLALMSFYHIPIVKDCFFFSHGKHYYVTSGAVFDYVSTHMHWLAGA